MTGEELSGVVRRRLELIQKVLADKAAEYAPGADKLINFRRGADLLGKTARQVCFGYLTKHLVSVIDIVERDARSEFVKPEIIDEKIGDSINYLILLEALFQEKY